MMGGIKRGLTLVGLLIAIATGVLQAAAQVATTTVSDTVYRADGTPAGGSVVVTWGAFTTADGSAVTAGTTTATIGTAGLLTIALAPNAGSTPMGSYYTAVFHLNDGTTTKEYWAIPAVTGGATVKLAGISTQVLPASVAMNAVSKGYVDTAIAMAEAGATPLDASPYVLKAGDTMTGPLNLPADPVTPTQAADMHYVDASVDAVSAGLGGKVALLPGGTQVVSQPSGTQLETNLLNGELYATQYVSGGGNNGIANAVGSADCTTGCEVKVEKTYPGGDRVLTNVMPALSQVEDTRGGTVAKYSVDPLGFNDGAFSAGESVHNVAVRPAAAMNALIPGGEQLSYALALTNNALAGGSNQFPQSVEAPPYFKSTYGVASLVGSYNTQGQHVQLSNAVNCYGVGDCLAGSQFILSEGGYRDSADEGTHPYDLSVEEDAVTFTGTCTGGCTTGSTTVTVTVTADAGTEGDGRFLIDKNPSQVISTGTLTGGTSGLYGIATFSGTSFPVSVFLQTAAAATSQVLNLSPGTVTLPIVTSGAPTGFATNTAALPAPSGVACVVDLGIPNYEMANYTVVDGTHVQVTLNKVHASGAAIVVGGLCGYGLEETVDTVGPLRQVFPVVGSTSSTSLYYASAATSVVGEKASTGAYLNDTFTVASISRTSNVVTVTASTNFGDNVNGLSMTIGGVADSSYNGTYTVTTTGPNTLTYANTGANSTSSSGTMSVTTGGFNLYPLAEVLSVYDPATKLVDGVLTLGPNTVAWANGDAVEEPHFPQVRVEADQEFVTQYLPRPRLSQRAGKYYQGVVGPGLIGWEVSNGEAATDYLGAGGTHNPPSEAYSVQGYWVNDFAVEPGEQSIMSVSCGVHGCNRWDSGYNMWAMSSATGYDYEAFAPQSDTVTWGMDGTTYSFSPTSFTAGTINVGTLNATTITGGIAGSTITSGTINAARLPLFGPSGTSHAPGAVPDPGATAGATRYLREDGTWVVPASTGGSATNLAGGAAYTVPYQTAAGATSYLSSPTANGTYFLTEAPAASAAVAPAWTNAATYLSSPPAIGGTTPNTGAFTTTVITGSFNQNYASAGTLGNIQNNNASGIVGYSFLNAGGTQGIFGFNTGYTAFSASVGSFFFLGNGVPICFMVSTTGACIEKIATAGTTAFSGAVTMPQVVGGGSTPTMAAGAGAGASPSCTTIAGANMAGVISCTTGTATVASSTLATVTFNGTLSAAPQGCKLMPRNAASAAAVTTVYTTAPTTAAWTIGVGGTALGASTAYSWSYDCL
jgi:trimeric autotransporter adhesin